MAAAAKKSAKKAATKSSAKTTTAPKAAAAPAPEPAPVVHAAPASSGGFFDVPTVEKSPWGILGLILNIIPYAGIGSIIVGAKAGAKNQLIKGIIQFLTGWLVIGWIWSIVDGIRIFTRSR